MLIADLELCKFVDRRADVTVGVANLVRHLLADSGQEFVELVFGPFGHELNAPVGQVANKPLDVEALGERMCCVAKADSLDVARVENLPALKC